MHTLDVIDSALQWETERQNRLHQQALELKKKQEADEAREGLAATASASVDIEPGLPDRVGRIPGMRSALIPLDEAIEGDAWSKPFALTKADLEPWTSFLAGYNQSRIFLQPATGAASAAAAQPQDPSRLDYAVRALLTLKRVPVRVLLEPPVQIDRQVEYQDPEAEMRAAAGRLRSDTMLKLALELHQKQLAKAVEAGRKLGDDLYEAMMGEGYCNLIRAWQRAHGRKPSIEELHLMLSSGKVQPVARRASEGLEEPLRKEVPRVSQPPRQSPATLAEQKATVPVAALLEEDDQSDTLVTLGGAQASAKRKTSSEAQKTVAKPPGSRRIYWYLLHAAATTASAAALTWFWLN